MAEAPCRLLQTIRSRHRMPEREDALILLCVGRHLLRGHAVTAANATPPPPRGGYTVMVDGVNQLTSPLLTSALASLAVCRRW